jgi:ubiquinone/menaquinone biosynthesis C-methylase UbiE
MALPFNDNRFDAAVMALVIFFVPDPARGVAEMTRVVCPGGMVAAYIWDILSDGSPTGPLQIELRALGVTMALPPRADVARMAVLRELWTSVGLEAVEVREIVVQRTFVDFEDFWHSTTSIPSVKQTIATMEVGDIEQLKARVCVRAPADAFGRVTYQARANAIRGRVPKS